MSTKRDALATNADGGGGLLDINRLAERIKERWRRGEIPNVAGTLASHPELRCHRTVVLDLAYQEYLHRLRTGEALDAAAFASEFPSFQKSLHLFIAVHGLLSCDPEHRALQGGWSWPEPGDRFLQFDLIAEIGRGSFGRVFLATEPTLGDRRVVVKVAPQGGEEAEVLARLRHPNIVPVYSLQEDGTGLAAFCMPYYGRATLCDVLDQVFSTASPPERASAILEAVAHVNDAADTREVPQPDAVLRRGSYVDGIVHLAMQLADALAHSHERGICHRDLKPSNVLVTPDGRPLLLDFNLSTDPKLAAAKIGGTVPYMAPEGLTALYGSPSEITQCPSDPRSDLFSLGVIVYELLTGELPFGAIPRSSTLDECARELHERQRQGPRPLRDRNRRVDSRLAGVIERCLAFELDERPATARELAMALRRELRPFQRCRRWALNYPKVVGGVAGAVLTTAIIVSLFFALRPPYSLRQLDLGLEYSHLEDYAKAVESLNGSIQADPELVKARVARGHAFQRLEQFELALQDYAAAYRLAPDPIVAASQGYCLSRIKSHRAAILAYQKAREGGFETAALLNNIGYSYIMLGQDNDAADYLRLAIKANDELQAPRFNMLTIFLRRAHHGERLTDEAFIHAAKAIEIGPPTADLYQVVASLYAVGAARDTKRTPEAVRYVCKALELGVKPESFASDPSFSVVRKEPAFEEAMRTRATSAASSRATSLLDPVAGP